MRKMIIAGFLAFILAAPSHACSWIPPDGMASDWVEDKVIFWGRAITSNQNRNNRGLSGLESYTHFEVLESLTGELPKKIKVYHDEYSSSCGTRFEPDDVRIFVVSKAKTADYFVTGSYYMESVDPIMLAAYFEHYIDVPILEWNKSRYWSVSDNSPCENAGQKTDAEPYFCKWQDVVKRTIKSYAHKKNDFEFAARQ